MPLSRIRLLCASLAAFALTGCSYVYEIRTIIIDGRIAFVVDPSSERKPSYIHRISVTVAQDGPVARPLPGDDRGLVLNGGMYRWENVDTSSCRNRFPIFYGERLEGVSRSYDGTASRVAPKPLRIGVVYEVNMISPSSHYGSGWFRITGDRRIESWTSDPTPADPDQNGYDEASGSGASLNQ